MRFEIRKIDAWFYDDGWVWNESWKICEFSTIGNPKRAFRRAMKNIATFERGSTLVVDDGDIIEIIDRKTKEPLFAALPM